MKPNILHLTVQELVLLYQGLASAELQQKAQKHCQICILCKSRKENLEQGNLSSKEKQMLDKWIKVSQIPKATLPIPFLWEGQQDPSHLAACAASSIQDLCAKPLRPHIPARENLQAILDHLNKLRIIFTIYEGSLYLEFLEVPICILRNLISQIQIGPHTFSSQNLDDQGGICLGKISSTTLSGEEVSHFKPQDLQNIRLEIRIDKV